MKNYYVMINVGPEKLTDDMLKDLKEAVEHAKRNLYTRHRIKIPTIERQDEYTAYIRLIDTKEVLTEKNVGIHLKGIANYLLKTYPEKYEPLKDGNRLIYCDVFEEFM